MIWLNWASCNIVVRGACVIARLSEVSFYACVNRVVNWCDMTLRQVQNAYILILTHKEGFFLKNSNTFTLSQVVIK